MEDGELYDLSPFCSLTFHIETHFLLDVTLGVPDSVAAFICTCDSTEGDLVFVDTDSTLVALRGRTHPGQQHQCRSVEGKVREDEPPFVVHAHHGQKMALEICLGKISV